MPIDWNQFKVRNPDSRGAFENLCYFLTSRRYQVDEGFERFHNQPGIETEPFYNSSDGKWYGFQAKFFQSGLDYQQVKASIETACQKKRDGIYPNLDIIEIYTNTDHTSRTQKDAIEATAKADSISIQWFLKSKIESLLAKPSYSDLAQLLFGISDVEGFIGSNFQPRYVNIFSAKTFLELQLTNKGATLPSSNFPSKLSGSSDRVWLLTGGPGSGKTLLMHRIAWALGARDKTNRAEAQKVYLKDGIPLLINLKDATALGVEAVIKNRKERFSFSGQSLKFIYLFDGLDELAQEKADFVLHEIFRIHESEPESKIVVSSRNGNLNLTLLFSYFPQAEQNRFLIQKITNSDIESYFSLAGNTQKTDLLKELWSKNPKLLENIDDVLLVVLLWENIQFLSAESSLIDLFGLKIDYLFSQPSHRKAIEGLNLPEPKKAWLIEINKELSLALHQKFEFKFSIAELSLLILSLLPKLSYAEVNAIIYYLSNALYSADLEATDGTLMIFQHRRYQEYFLALKLVDSFKKEKKILRDVNTLGNTDFIENLFLPAFKKDAVKEDNLPQSLEANLFKAYYDWDRENSIIRSNELCEALASLDNATASQLISSDDSIYLQHISLNQETIRTFWEAGHTVIANDLLDKLRVRFDELQKSNPDDAARLVSSHFEDHLYILLEILNGDSAKIFKERVRSRARFYKRAKDIMAHDKKAYIQGAYNSFWKLLLKRKPNEVASFLPTLSSAELELFCNVLLHPKFMPAYFASADLRKAMRKALLSYKKKIAFENCALYFFKVQLKIDTSTLKLEQVEKLMKELVDKDRFHYWRENLYEYTALSFLRSFLTPKHIKEWKKIYTDLEEYAILFRAYLALLEGKTRHVEALINEHSSYETHYIHQRFLTFEVSTLWALIFSQAKQPKLHNALSRLFDEQSFISKLAFYLALKRQSKDLFERLISEGDIDALLKKTEKWDDDYSSLVSYMLDLCYLYASFNQKNSLKLLNRVSTDSLIRHGWHKDTIVSYGLIPLFKDIFSAKLYSKEELRAWARKLMVLSFRVLDITDGDHTTDAPDDLIRIAAHSDMELAEELKKKLLEEKGSRWMRKVYTDLVHEKIEQCYPKKDIEDELADIRPEYDFEGKPRVDYFENKIGVLIAGASSTFYSAGERKDFFLKAHSLAKEGMEVDKSYFFHGEEHAGTLRMFKELCRKYHLKNPLWKIKIQKRNYNFRRRKIAETDFIKSVQSAKTQVDMDAIYARFKEFKYDIELSTPASWRILFEKTLSVYGNVAPLLEYLSHNNYPSYLGNWTANTERFHYVLADILGHPKTRFEGEKYLITKSGHGGFKNVGKTLLELKRSDRVRELFEEYYSFCLFLTS